MNSKKPSSDSALSRRFRFFAPAVPSAPGEQCVLDEVESRHALKVLRLSEGDAIEIFDGRGSVAHAEVAGSEGKRLRARITDHHHQARPEGACLRCALPKGAKVDWILQKGVELGAREIIFIEAERSIARLPDQEDMDARLRRWRDIAVSAAKQCGAVWLPVLGAVESLAESLRRDTGKILWAADDRPGAVPMRERVRGVNAPASPCIYIGPEGGWSSDEATLFEPAGAQFISLGPRILRAETAALHILSAWLYEKTGT